jgi:hypothetical protein
MHRHALKLCTMVTGVITAFFVLASPVTVSPVDKRAFEAELLGIEVVPPFETEARGHASFELSTDGTQLHYKVVVNNAQNITMSHIHLGLLGENGPVVAWLYPKGPPPKLIPGWFLGVLGEGDITAALLVGPLKDKSIADLVREMRNGNTYVVVHTQEHPDGEIRGQIY